ncbi:MAG: SIMPL domain-containing protein [Solirubrobacterales bacterium]
MARRLLTLSLALAALALPAAPAAVASARSVSVSATATVLVPRDSARVGFGVSKERRSRSAALRAASAKLAAVIAAAKGVPGVEPGAIRTGAISVRKVSRGTGTVYRASQGISVTLRQAERAGELVRAGIAAGATGVRGPYFFVADTGAAERRALTAAFEKARARAATLAAAAGAALGPVLEIDEGEAVFGGDFEKGTSASGEEAAGVKAPVPPTKPGTQKVTATVHAVFELL